MSKLKQNNHNIETNKQLFHPNKNSNYYQFRLHRSSKKKRIPIKQFSKST